MFQKCPCCGLARCGPLRGQPRQAKSANAITVNTSRPATNLPHTSIDSRPCAISPYRVDRWCAYIRAPTSPAKDTAFHISLPVKRQPAKHLWATSHRTGACMFTQPSAAMHHVNALGTKMHGPMRGIIRHWALVASKSIKTLQRSLVRRGSIHAQPDLRTI